MTIIILLCATVTTVCNRWFEYCGVPHEEMSGYIWYRLSYIMIITFYPLNSEHPGCPINLKSWTPFHLQFAQNILPLLATIIFRTTIISIRTSGVKIRAARWFFCILNLGTSYYS